LRQETLERRIDLLKLEGNGLLPPEITKELSQKYGVTPRTLQYDFQYRDKWQPQIESLKDAFNRIINRHNQLYRKASLSYLQAETNREKQGAINLMRSINKDAFDMLFPNGVEMDNEAIKEIILRWKHIEPINLGC